MIMKIIAIALMLLIASIAICFMRWLRYKGTLYEPIGDFFDNFWLIIEKVLFLTCLILIVIAIALANNQGANIMAELSIWVQKVAKTIQELFEKG